MNFKDNIERCKTAQAMGYRVQFRGESRTWFTMACSYSSTPEEYRVHPDDEEAFEADLAAREDAAMRRSPAPDHTEVLAKLLPLLGSLPGVTADITVTLHIKV